MSNPRIPFRLSSERARLPAPGGLPLLVHVVVNVEHWPFENPMPRQMLTPPHGVQPRPDVPNFSWAEYGMRCGMPRLVELFERHKIPVSTTINASVIDTYPSLAAMMRDAGWEFMGHGVIQRSLQQEQDERQVIRTSVERLAAYTGRKVRGWLGPGLHETKDTPELLKEAGIDYICDWVLDDLPCWMTTANGPIIAMPYALETNDAVMYAIEKQPADEIVRRVTDTLTTFGPELDRNPRVLTLALHPYAIAVPHRLPHLAHAIELLKSRVDAQFMNGSAIADWYASVEKP